MADLAFALPLLHRDEVEADPSLGAISVAKRAEFAGMGIDPLAIAPQQVSHLGCIQYAGGRPRRDKPPLEEDIGERLRNSANVAVRDVRDVLMLEGHERKGRRAAGGGEIVLADEKARIIEILLRTMEDTYVLQRLQTTARGYPRSSGSQRPPAGAGSVVVRRACIA
jgi:hypothetical protein